MRIATEIIPSFKTVNFIALSLILIGCGGGSSKKEATAVTASSSTTIVASSSAPASSVAASVASSAVASSTAADTIQISGAAVAQSDDVIEVASLSEDFGRYIAKLNPIALAWAAVDTGASDNNALPNATVTLVKVFGGGKAAETVDIGTVTTASDGSYTIPAVEKVPDSDGTDASFYYEVRVTKDDLVLKTPIAANTDVVANISPETDLAAKILSDVVTVPGLDNAPLPDNKMVESIRELVLSEAAGLSDTNSIAIPSATSTDFDANSVAAANGLAANGENAEKLFKAASFSAETMALENNTATTDEEATGYINRVIREGCNQSQNDYLPQPIAEAFGEYFNEEGTLTATQIVAAYNQNFSGPDVVLDTVVENFSAMLADVSDKLTAPAVDSAPIASNKQLALYTMRTLDPTTFTATTELDADQALALIQTLGNNQCQFTAQLDLFGFVAQLLTKPALALPAIATADIYHNSGFGCNEGAGKGHFAANVKVNRKNKIITSVTIASNDSDTTVLGGDAIETLSAGAVSLFSTYSSNDNGICVNLGKEVSYTVTANFSDATSVSTSVERNHPRIPEASSKVYVGDAFVAGSNDSAHPTVVAVSRPLYQWEAPDVLFARIANDTVNASVKTALLDSDYEVKYTYEFAHVNTAASPVSPAGQCEQIASGPLYSVDSFNPTKDCNVEACATALGVAPADISCRMNIQSYLVDKNDKILGQAAGHFRFFCVDTDEDGNCG